MPSLCACNENFTVVHALPGPKGGNTKDIMSEFRDSIAYLLSDVYHDVEIEPHHQPLQGETFALKSTTNDDDDDDARLDIKPIGLWESRFNKTNFDVKFLTR